MLNESANFIGSRAELSICPARHDLILGERLRICWCGCLDSSLNSVLEDSHCIFLNYIYALPVTEELMAVEHLYNSAAGREQGHARRWQSVLGILINVKCYLCYQSEEWSQELMLWESEAVRTENKFNFSSASNSKSFFQRMLFQFLDHWKGEKVLEKGRI